MNEKIYKLLFPLNYNNSEYSDFSNFILDEKINECLLKLYFSLMTEDEVSDKYYLEFESIFNDLNEEQKEVVKRDLIDILNKENKPKVKKKER